MKKRKEFVFKKLKRREGSGGFCWVTKMKIWTPLTWF